MIVLVASTLAYICALFALVLLALKYWREWRQPASVNTDDLSQAIALFPAVFVELQPTTEDSWQQLQALLNDKKLLKQAGFIHQQDAQATSGQSLTRLSFWQHPKSPVGVVIKEQDAAVNQLTTKGYCHEIHLSDGRQQFMLTNTAEAATWPRPANQLIKILATADLRTLLTQLKNHRPASLAAAKKISPADLYQNRMQTQALWLLQQEQLRSDAVQQVLAAQSISLSEDLLSGLIGFGQEQTNEYYKDKVAQQVKRNTKMTDKQWHQLKEKMIIIHEKMTTQNLCDALYDLYEYQYLAAIEPEIDKALNQAVQPNPFELLEVLSDKIQRPLPKCIGQMETPVVAKIYLSHSHQPKQ